MSSFIPITLVGDNLGQRHRYLNSLVALAHQQGVPLESLQDIPEQSPVDRLFKIGLAARYKDVNYILRNLKDEDMLYVSKALKCLWLLKPQYSDIINPTYLEDVLFPEMTTTAVTKMRHWIQHHLRDAHRCQAFYEYYKKKNNSDIANKFLLNCSGNFLLKEVSSDLLNKLSPKYFKIICEKHSLIAKLYFNSLGHDKSVVAHYLDKENEYYNKLKFLLKADADLYLDIIEKYFNNYIFPHLSSAATAYIMTHHKNRFIAKPELYTAWLLDMKTLAKFLSSEEIKDIIVKLAKAEYLSSWFSYKNVEPLIKSLNLEERNSLKKQVFIDKNVGEKVQSWPYTPPSGPTRDLPEKCVFSDIENAIPISLAYDFCGMRYLESANCAAYSRRVIIKPKTLLDKLFDQYRFVSFERVLFELRKQMTAESSAENRQYMMLVLVSKSGGRAESVRALLELLAARHSNEPATLRAAVVRSLVRRAAAWRLPPASWTLLAQFAHGLGLDGAPAAAACSEGLHAAMLRCLLAEPERVPEPTLLDAFLNADGYSPLAEYPLSATERRLVRERLPALLLTAAAAEPAAKPARLGLLLDALDAHKQRVDACPGVVDAVAEAAQCDPHAATDLLRRLYRGRVARCRLFRENFVFMRTDESYVNALRHDASLLDERFDLFEDLIAKHELQHEWFLRKLALYFGEADGLAARHLALLELNVAKNPRVELARPVALLAGEGLVTRLRALDIEPAGSAGRRFAAALRAHAHTSRPQLSFAMVEWRTIGAKAVSTRLAVCSMSSACGLLPKLLTWPRTARLALALALRLGEEASAFASVAMMRPGTALKVALRYWWRRQAAADPRVWLAMSPLIARLDFSLPARERLCRDLVHVDRIPVTFKADYFTVVYKALQNVSINQKTLLLRYLENLLPELDEDFVSSVIEDFLRNDFIPKKVVKINADIRYYVRIIGRFLLLSKTEIAQENRFKIIGDLFFKRMESLQKLSNEDFLRLLDIFIRSLKYTKVFFGSESVACLHLFEIIIARLRKLLPMEQYFNIYIFLHLTMLYYKSIRLSLKLNPEVFEIESNKKSEGVKIVGKIYGKYIAHEIEELTSRYFPSVSNIYQEEVVRYIKKHFIPSENRNEFLFSIVTGLLEERNVNGHLIAKYIYKKEMEYVQNADSIHQILKNIDNQEMKFFCYADLYL